MAVVASRTCLLRKPFKLSICFRNPLFRPVVARLQGADVARQALIKEVESANFTLLPGNRYLRPSAWTTDTDHRSAGRHPQVSEYLRGH